ncbi:RNA polymerase sigma factor SigJ [Nocardia sp. CA-107356]|uniref:RNA polymerase sigma factor SigJ n=1 Tax=Nocardia sp. CA-107356 TaxID=3239972 RepID=UPI003D92AA7B
MTPETADGEIDSFLDQRELLFSIVYNMLGTVADTEDVLQEAWLAWSTRHRGVAATPVENPRAYLVRVCTHLAIARRAAMRRNRETYIGPWLPEPLVAIEDDAAATLERKESLTMAVLVVLETLSPLERVVFVLHDVFGFAHGEIAEILDRSPAAVRQLAVRARRHIHARRPRATSRPDAGAEVAQRLMAVTLGGDLAALLEALAPGVTLWTDSGGRGVAKSLEPVHGRDRVAALFMAISADPRPTDLTIDYRYVAGDPCALIFSGSRPFALVVIELAPESNLITAIYSITNPDKMSGIR